MKLSDDEKQDILALIEDPGYLVFRRLLDEVLSDFARGVLNSPMSGPDDERRLFYTKAHYEGVKKFRSHWDQIIKDLKKEER